MRNGRIIPLILLIVFPMFLFAQQQSYYQLIERDINYIKVAEKMCNITISDNQPSNRVTIYSYKLDQTSNGFLKTRYEVDMSKFKGLITVIDDTLVINFNKRLVLSDSILYLSVQLKKFPKDIIVQQNGKVHINASAYTPYLSITADKQSTVSVNNIFSTLVDTLLLNVKEKASVTLNNITVRNYFSLYADSAMVKADNSRIDHFSKVVNYNSEFTINGTNWTAFVGDKNSEKNFYTEYSANTSDKSYGMMPERPVEMFWRFSADITPAYSSSRIGVYGNTVLNTSFNCDFMINMKFTTRFAVNFGAGAGIGLFFGINGNNIERTGMYSDLGNVLYRDIEENFYMITPQLRIPLTAKYYFTKKKSEGKALEFGFIAAFHPFKFSFSDKQKAYPITYSPYENTVISNDYWYAAHHKGETYAAGMNLYFGLDFSKRFGIYFSQNLIPLFKEYGESSLYFGGIGFHWNVK